MTQAWDATHERVNDGAVNGFAESCDAAMGYWDEPASANGTLPDVMTKYGVTWADYFTDLPALAIVPPNVENYPANFLPFTQFFVDATIAAAVANYKEDTESKARSVENPQDIALGEIFVSQAINAVMNGPQWSKTLTSSAHGSPMEFTYRDAAASASRVRRLQPLRRTS